MFLTFLLLLLLFPLYLSIDTLTVDQSLVDGDVLLSNKRTFALGFFSPGHSKYRYLGIWYHELPGKDVVWVANRGNPINDTSGVLLINQDGNLVLYNSKDPDFPLWYTNVSLEVTDTYVAQLLDTGNLRLVQNESKITVWQSFDYPTDTMLPGMRIGQHRKLGMDWFLTSWKSLDDPAIGESSLKLDPTGSPQLFMYKGLTKYWRSNPWPWLNLRPQAYKYYFRYNQDEVWFSYLVDDDSTLTRTVLQNFGLLQRLTWDNSSRQWKEYWSAPNYNYGHCGAYSIHNANIVYGFKCTCLPGYEPKSLKNWHLRDGSGGCVRKRQQTTSFCESGEGFIKVTQVKRPDTSIAVLMNTSLSIEECEQLCLKNCSCVAFASLDNEEEDVGCLMWHGELVDIMQINEGVDMYVRVDAIELAMIQERAEDAMKKCSSSRMKKMLAIAGGLSIALTIFLTFSSSYLLRWKRRKMKGTMKQKGTKQLHTTLIANALLENGQTSDLQFFGLDTMYAATNNFSPSNKLGRGGFGSVYKGLLPNGQDIAVKRLSNSSKQGIEELKNEVMLIARLQHRNLVKIIGCCIQGEEKMLIYEYMPNKSLDAFIFDERRRSLLDWTKRFDIIVGIARGILYLHHDSRLRIVHRDLKTSNVLLDATMNPKISDFGLARIFNVDQVQDETKRVVGTYGYMSPEYVVSGIFSIKSDVFSFGVILLEIISGRKSSSFYHEDSSESLIEHVWNLWRKGRVLDIVDPLLTESHIPAEVIRCIRIGLLCVQHDAIDRPTMPEVMHMLNGETSLPLAKQPAFIFKHNDPSSSRTRRRRPWSINQVSLTDVEAR